MFVVSILEKFLLVQSDEYQVNYDNRPLITTEVANSQSSNGSSSVYGTVSISGEHIFSLSSYYL